LVPREKLVEESVESDPRVAALEDRSLMVLDDDAPFRARLARALGQRGFDVASLGSVSEARDHLRKTQPAFAVVDLRLEDGSGLEIVEALQRSREDSHAVILTGYGAISTAVAAVKAGAIDYLPKPADIDDIVNALLTGRGNRPEPPENPMSADRVRWEHIQRVYELCNHNVSETARRLNMHRRTLQRILAKRAPR
jgi:two-component system response regulator RegA